MKTHLANQARLTFIASIAACAIVICGPFSTLAAAQDSSTPQRNTQSASNHIRNESAEDRIKHLHDQLKITPEQEAQWSNVARVMLDNASAVDKAIKDRIATAASMTAIDDLRSYQAIVQTHADGLKKLAAAFMPLYSAMPEAQQRNADAVFGHRTNASKLKTHG
jgi:protein CpxP